MEIWKTFIEGSNIEVSSFGRIKRIESLVKHPLGGLKRVKEGILKTFQGKSGYCYLNTTIQGKKKTFLVHRMVAKTFIPNPENKPCVNHKDGNKANNRIENLEWCTYSENERHSHEVLGKKTASPWLGKPSISIPASKPFMLLDYGVPVAYCPSLKVFSEAIGKHASNIGKEIRETGHYMGYKIEYISKEKFLSINADIEVR